MGYITGKRTAVAAMQQPFFIYVATYILYLFDHVKSIKQRYIYIFYSYLLTTLNICKLYVSVVRYVYCTVCGYGGESKEVCPRCGATDASLLEIPALAQGPAYIPDELDLERDEIGFTNPNLHVRMDKQITGNYQTINYPPGHTVSVTDFSTADGEITGYTGSDTSPIIPALLPKYGTTIIGAGAFKDKDLYFVDIPEGITEIK